MNQFDNTSLVIATKNLVLKASISPWDTINFNFPVAVIEEFKILDKDNSLAEFSYFNKWREEKNIGIVSCRLNINQLVESIQLEEFGFKFIEVVLHPRIDNLEKLDFLDQGLKIELAFIEDIPAIQKIAEMAFKNERFHVDPRLDPTLGDKRYGAWVANILNSQNQTLLKIIDGDKLIAFFIVEVLNEGTIYWHLTAISPQYQGMGYGKKVWTSMLRYHQLSGASSISTTISVRNTRVHNLYAKLNFQFTPAEMTYHWVRN